MITLTILGWVLLIAGSVLLGLTVAAYFLTKRYSHIYVTIKGKTMIFSIKVLVFVALGGIAAGWLCFIPWLV